MTLAEDDVSRILTFLMADSLSVHSPVIDDLAQMLGTDMSEHWQPDETFFVLIRDKQVLNTMVGEYAGQSRTRTSFQSMPSGAGISCTSQPSAAARLATLFAALRPG
jgi:hypothetical protein